MLEYTISVTQYTPVGRDQRAQTKIYIICLDGDKNWPVWVGDDSDKRLGKIMATVIVRHPAVLAGSWEENLSYFKRLALEEVREQGHIRKEKNNDYWQD